MPNLQIVNMYADVYLACLEHALSTESEEVMGLLIGELEDGHSTISAYETLRRLDKRKDRVEISFEQLTEATEKAERLAKHMNKPLRIVGWFHSHPHITVFPSHVDLNTQLNYQQLDNGFVGMIISVFSEDKSKKDQEIVVSCFQTITQQVPRYIKLCIIPRKISAPCLEAMIRLPDILLLEEDELYQAAYNRGRNSSLACAQNQAERTKSISGILGRISIPLLLSVNARIEENKQKKEKMEKEILELQKDVKHTVELMQKPQFPQK